MSNIPKEFICPISLSIMRVPVVCSDGHTYEKDAIEEALRYKNESPLTREVMYATSLRVNYALRDSIENWLRTNPQTTSITVSKFIESPLVLKSQLYTLNEK